MSFGSYLLPQRAPACLSFLLHRENMRLGATTHCLTSSDHQRIYSDKLQRTLEQKIDVENCSSIEVKRPKICQSPSRPPSFSKNNRQDPHRSHGETSIDTALRPICRKGPKLPPDRAAKAFFKSRAVRTLSSIASPLLLISTKLEHHYTARSSRLQAVHQLPTKS